MPETILVGPLPPPAHGQSVSFQMLADAYRDRAHPHCLINISEGHSKRGGRFTYRRVLSLMGPFTRALRMIARRGGNFYMTNSQSWVGFMRDWVFINIARLGGYRVILHLKGGGMKDFYLSQSDFRQSVIRKTLSKADKLAVLSETLRPMYDFVPGHEQKVVVVYNGLPLPLPDFASTLEKKSKGQGPIRLLYLSNLIESKGYLDLLEAVRILVNEMGLDVTANFCGLFMVGDESEFYKSVDEAEADFHKRIKDAGLEERVKWLGNVKGAEKTRQLEEADFFALPTYYENEGQPVSIIESMGYGALVISSRHRTIPEMLDNGTAGILVPIRDAGAIAEAVANCRPGSRDYEVLVAQARKRCEDVFAKERHLDRLISVIED